MEFELGKRSSRPPKARQGLAEYNYGSLIILNPDINETPGAIDSLAKLLDYSKRAKIAAKSTSIAANLEKKQSHILMRSKSRRTP